MQYKFRNFELKISISLKKENFFIYSNLAHLLMVLIMFLATPTPHAFSRQRKDQHGELIFIPLYYTTNIGKCDSKILSYNEIKKALM